MSAALLLLLLAGPPAPADAARLTPPQLSAVVAEVAKDVERLRGLRFKTPVSMEVVDPRTTRKTFAAHIDASVTEAARHAQSAYIQLGLTPPGTDLIRSYLERAESDVLGYYDRRTKKLFLVSTVPADEVRGVVAHELTHALEDQHFDFASVSRQATSDDHATAISSVIEGSAMFVMFRYLREKQDRWAQARASRHSLRQAKALAHAPSFVQQTAVMPYVLGFSFMLKGRPWDIGEVVQRADLDGAYAEPPRSTRQILHPEQYWVGRSRRPPPPTLDDLSKALGEGWTKALEGAIGELGLACMTGTRLDLAALESFLPQTWTNPAAVGSTGDVFHHYVNGNRRVTVLLTEWESLRDAQQFAAALRKERRAFFEHGATVLVVGGDVGDRMVPLATAALQNRSTWVKR